MSVTVSYPGVYIQELPSSVHTVTPAPTSVTVFVGYTNPFWKLPGGDPPWGAAVELFSFADYENTFGGFFSSPYLPDYVGRAVFQFFENGGSHAWVVAIEPSEYFDLTHHDRAVLRHRDAPGNSRHHAAGGFLMYDLDAVRRDFPILAREVHGRPLVYLDNGASAQKPRAVIDAVSEVYASEYANVHRGLHTLSNLATERYEATRGIVQRFLGARHEDEIVFTSGSTMAINMVSYAWAAPRFEPGDEIVLSVMEHHANIVPWHFLRERQGAVLKWVDIEPDGSLDPMKVLEAVGPRTRLIAVTHMSNVLGTVGRRPHHLHRGAGDGGAGAGRRQPGGGASAGRRRRSRLRFLRRHRPQALRPTGSGALYATRERLAEMRPFLGGGDMIREVRKDAVELCRPAAADGGGHARHRADHRARGGARRI